MADKRGNATPKAIWGSAVRGGWIDDEAEALSVEAEEYCRNILDDKTMLAALRSHLTMYAIKVRHGREELKYAERRACLREVAESTEASIKVLSNLSAHPVESEMELAWYRRTSGLPDFDLPNLLNRLRLVMMAVTLALDELEKSPENGRPSVVTGARQFLRSQIRSSFQSRGVLLDDLQERKITSLLVNCSSLKEPPIDPRKVPQIP